MNECKDCRFWKPIISSPETRGQCRFNPPTVFSSNGFRDSAWAVTNYDNWCGKFEPKEKNNESHA